MNQPMGKIYQKICVNLIFICRHCCWKQHLFVFSVSVLQFHLDLRIDQCSMSNVWHAEFLPVYLGVVDLILLEVLILMGHTPSSLKELQRCHVSKMWDCFFCAMLLHFWHRDQMFPFNVYMLICTCNFELVKSANQCWVMHLWQDCFSRPMFINSVSRLRLDCYCKAFSLWNISSLIVSANIVSRCDWCWLFTLLIMP